MDKKNAPDDFSIEEILEEARTLRERQAAEHPQEDVPVEEWNGPARAQALPVDGSRPSGKKKKRHSHPAQQKKAQASSQQAEEAPGIKEPKHTAPARKEPNRSPRVEEPARREPERGMEEEPPVNTAELHSLLNEPEAEPKAQRAAEPEPSMLQTAEFNSLLTPFDPPSAGAEPEAPTEPEPPEDAEPAPEESREKKKPPVLQTAELESLLPPAPEPERPAAEWEREEDFEELPEEPRKLTWKERRAEKKFAREERRRLKRAAKGLEEEDDIYYGLQLKPLTEYKKQYEQTLDMGNGGTENPAASGATFSYLFNSSDEEVDEEIAARFANIHNERRQRVAQMMKETGTEPDDIFHLYGTATNTIELKFPNRSHPEEPDPDPEEETAQHLVPVENQTQEFTGAVETGELPAEMPSPVVHTTPEGETFEFPSIGELNRSRRTVAIESMEEGTFEMPATDGLEDIPPVPEEPVRTPTPEPPVPMQEPRAPIELPQPGNVTPLETPQPIRAQGKEQMSAAVPANVPKEEPVRTAQAQRASFGPQDYRPVGVTPVHVIELHNYAEVILREAKTYPKPAPLHIPSSTAEIPAQEPQKDILLETTKEIVLPPEEQPEEPGLAPAMGDPPPEVIQLPISRKKPVEEPKPEKKFSIVGEEEPDNDPQENIPEEEPEELDDYQSPSDAPSVQHELGSRLRALSLRLSVTGILTVLMLGTGFLGEKTAMLPEMFRLPLPTQTYLIVSLAFLCVAALFSWVTLWNGIKALFRLQANSDSGAALAVLAAIGQSVSLLFQTQSVAKEELHSYAALACLALFLNTAGKLSLIKRISRNFRFVASPDSKFSVEIYEDHNTALQMAKGVVADTPVIAYQHRTNFLRHFLRFSYENDPADQSSQFIAPIGFILSLVLCGVSYFLTKSVAAAVTAFTAAMCMSVPMANMLCVNLPLARLTRIATRCGAMVVGWPAVEKFSEANAMVLDAKDLFPKGTVILNGIKTFEGQRIDDAIMDATALMYATGGPLSDLFDQIIKSRREMLPKIENITYEDGKGVTGWVAGRRVLVGNRELMICHSIEPPSRDYEEKYLVGGKQIVYFASGGDLVAMFVVSYNSDRRRAMELRRMEDNGIGLIVRTCDPNITPRFLAEVFSIGEHSVRVLPEGLGKEYGSLIKKPLDRSDAYLATKGRPTAVMRLLAACVRQRGNISIAVALQNVAVVLGVVLVAFLACYSGLNQLTTSAMLLFELFWVAAILIVPRIRRP